MYKQQQKINPPINKPLAINSLKDVHISVRSDYYWDTVNGVYVRNDYNAYADIGNELGQLIANLHDQPLNEINITLSQLKNIIKETLEVHQVPVDLDTVDSEEAYGIGYMKGKEFEHDSTPAPDEAFSAGCTVCGDESGQCGHEEVCSDCGCSHPDWSPSCSKNDNAGPPDLSTKFAREAEAKSAALSATAHFSDALQLGGDHIPDDILSNIYKALLGLARDAKK